MQKVDIVFLWFISLWDMAKVCAHLIKIVCTVLATAKFSSFFLFPEERRRIFQRTKTHILENEGKKKRKRKRNENVKNKGA